MRTILFGLSLVLVGLPALAQNRDENLARCVDDNRPNYNPDTSLGNCTALIQSGKEPTQILAQAYHNRALAYGHKGLNSQAIADYTQAIALKPDYAIAYIDRGGRYDAGGFYDLAISDFTQAIALMPADAEIYNSRGYAYNAKGFYDQAIADFTQAVALKSDYGGPYNPYNNRALAYHLKGDDAKGLPDANKAIALAPVANHFDTRAEIYEKLGQKEQSLSDYRAALKLSPNDSLAREGIKRLGAAP